MRGAADLDQLQALRLDAVQQAIGVAVTVVLQTGRDLAIVAGILAAGLTLVGQVLGGSRAVAVGS